MDPSSLQYQWTTSLVEPVEGSFSSSFVNGQSISTREGVTGGYYLWVLAKDVLANKKISRSNVFNLDNIAPAITILGDNPVNITVGDTYVDAGATAIDNIDGDITSEISVTTNLNVNVAGTYTVTYNVSDNALNEATEVIRTVNVNPDNPIIADGLVFHLDAAAITGLNHGNKISQWNDLSSSNKILNQGTDSKRPVFEEGTLNGNNAAKFNSSSSNEMQLNSNLVVSNEVTYIIVANTTINSFFYEGITSGNGAKIGKWGTEKFFIRLVPGGNSDDTLSWPLGNDVGIIYVQRDSNNKVDVAFNGGTFNRLFGNDAHSGNVIITRIGTGADSGQFINGYIAEFIAYDRLLTSQERQNIEQHLQQKWLE